MQGSLLGCNERETGGTSVGHLLVTWCLRSQCCPFCPIRAPWGSEWVGSWLQIFQQKREDKSFEKRAEETLRRIAAGPASNVEVTDHLSTF